MFLPPLEEFAGIDTYLKLLEWSDLNRPLMRRLSIEAPGTFAHTMRIANLAEAACTAIGANGLLARVGAYYHDIGKLMKPEYFVENQPRGPEPPRQAQADGERGDHSRSRAGGDRAGGGAPAPGRAVRVHYGAPRHGADLLLLREGP